jgi:hypothetical protein
VLVGLATDALVGELLAVNALYRQRLAQGVVSLGDKYSDRRLEAACNKALSARDPSYKTVKGILVAGTENEAVQAEVPRLDAPAVLHGPEAFTGNEER